MFSGFLGSVVLPELFPVLGVLGVGVTLGVVEPLEGLSAGLFVDEPLPALPLLSGAGGVTLGVEGVVLPLDELLFSFLSGVGFVFSGFFGSVVLPVLGLLGVGVLGVVVPLEGLSAGVLGLLGSCFPDSSDFLSSGLLGFSSFFLGSTFSLFFVGSSFFVQEVPPHQCQG